MSRDACRLPPRQVRPTAATLKIKGRRCEGRAIGATVGATRRHRCRRLGAIPVTAHSGGAAASLERAHHPGALAAAEIRSKIQHRRCVISELAQPSRLRVGSPRRSPCVWKGRAEDSHPLGPGNHETGDLPPRHAWRAPLGVACGIGGKHPSTHRQLQRVVAIVVRATQPARARSRPQERGTEPRAGRPWPRHPRDGASVGRRHGAARGAGHPAITVGKGATPTQCRQTGEPSS